MSGCKSSTPETLVRGVDDDTLDRNFVFLARASDGFAESFGTIALATSSRSPPFADAGSDRIVNLNAVVILDGFGSFDPDGDTFTYLWTQVAGNAIEEVVSVPGGSPFPYDLQIFGDIAAYLPVWKQPLHWIDLEGIAGARVFRRVEEDMYTDRLAFCQMFDRLPRRGFRKRLEIDASFYTFLQTLSATVFDKTQLQQLIRQPMPQTQQADPHNQLNLFD